MSDHTNTQESCDYRNPECAAYGQTVGRRWVCNNHICARLQRCWLNPRASAAASSPVAPSPKEWRVCTKCGKPREVVSAETFVCRYCFGTESVATAAPVTPSDAKLSLDDTGNGWYHVVREDKIIDGCREVVYSSSDRAFCELLVNAVNSFPAAVPVAPADNDGEGFPWGTQVTINGEQYWLNQCLRCASTAQPTYHVIKGEPQPSLNELISDED